MDAERTIHRLREELLGRYFTTRSEIRHLAERAGFAFVPVEFLAEGEREALVALRPEGMGEVLVQAERPVPSQPYHIVEVRPADRGP